jgi:hypothetical protein
VFFGRFGKELWKKAKNNEKNEKSAFVKGARQGLAIWPSGLHFLHV